MVERIPLSTLLSQTLVAFTIEIDNEAEHRQPHWTTASGREARIPGGPWLTSMAMYLNCMRWLPEEGLTVRELERRARTNANLDGMRRWGYVTVALDGTDLRVKSPKRDWIVRPTAAGRRAQQIWRPLFGVIEERWRERFGGLEVDALREALAAVVKDLELDLNLGLPDCMPILGYGLLCKGPDEKLGPRMATEEPLTLPALLARVLLACALEFEQASRLSLAICANVLRVLDETGVKLRDVPERSGVSKESIAMAMGILKKWKLAAVAKEGKWQVVRLTALGAEVRRGSIEGLRRLEARLVERFGERIERMRAALEPIVGNGTAEGSMLFQGLEPYPDGWRAMVRRPKVLPHFPMVLHRGGYPDGS
jgi:hypothetical protein